MTIKGQTTLPKAVRLALGIVAGDRVRYVIDGEDVRIIPVKTVLELAGSLAYEGPIISLEDIDEAVALGASGQSE